MSTKQKLEAETAIINTFKKLKDQLDDVRRDVINAIQVITDKNRDTGVESTTTDEFKQDTIEEIVRNHVKLLRVINSRRGFSKGTVLYGGY